MSERDLALAARIRLAMTDARLTQAELAHMAELTPDKLSKVFACKRRVSSLELALISQATGWSVEKLLGISIDVTGYRDGYRDAINDAALAFRQGRFSAFLRDSSPLAHPSEGSCERPPAGWSCNLERGHEGPCPTRTAADRS
jgi:transcriptional regulator with XRE-family HTH domain